MPIWPLWPITNTEEEVTSGCNEIQETLGPGTQGSQQGIKNVTKIWGLCVSDIATLIEDRSKTCSIARFKALLCFVRRLSRNTRNLWTSSRFYSPVCGSWNTNSPTVAGVAPVVDQHASNLKESSSSLALLSVLFELWMKREVCSFLFASFANL